MRFASLALILFGSFAYADEWPRPKSMAFVPLPSPKREEATAQKPQATVASPAFSLRLTFTVPDGATIWLDDKPVTFGVRTVLVPPISVRSFYTVKVQWNGKTVERKVFIEPGVDQNASFMSDFNLDGAAVGNPGTGSYEDPRTIYRQSVRSYSVGSC